MASMSPLPFAVVLVGVLIAAGTDLWKFRLHNALTIPLLISGLVYDGVTGGARGLTTGVLGALVGGLPFLFIYVKGGMGAGDIKLLAAVGAWIGPWPVLHVLIVSGLATGCYSAGVGAWKQFQHHRMQHRHIQHRPVAGSQSGAPEDRQPGSASDPDAEVCAAALDVTSILSRPDKRWNAVPFGVMVALGVVVTALWLG